MISFSLLFSTTATWNWRGSRMMATNDNSVVANSVSNGGCRVNRPAVCWPWRAASNSAPGPPNIQNVTKMPTARKANSLMIDSVAIASINPS